MGTGGILKSKTRIKDEIVAAVRRIRRDLDLTPYSGWRLVAIDPIAIEASRLRYLIDCNYKLLTVDGMRHMVNSLSYRKGLAQALGINPATGDAYSLVEATQWLHDRITQAARNYGVTRYPAAPATGVVRFYSLDSGQKNISEGSSVYTASGIEFKTTQNVVNETPRTDYRTGYHYVDVRVKCTEDGPKGNVGAGIINQLGSISGFTYCSNLNLTRGGRFREGLGHLLRRLETAKTTYTIPQRGGYEKFMYRAGCRDVAVIMPGDDDNVRPGFVDIYVQFTRLGTEEQTQQVLPSSNEIALRKQPVNGILSVVAGGVPLTHDVDFKFTKNTKGTSAYSIAAKDRITFLAGHKPAPGTAITVEYERNERIEYLQSLLNTGARYDVVGKVLVKESPPVPIDIGITNLVLRDGYNLSTVKRNIENSLIEYFEGGSIYTGKLMGDSVQESDVIAAIDNTEGVDYFRTPLTYFCKSGEMIRFGPRITINKYEHVILGDIYYIDVTTSLG